MMRRIAAKWAAVVRRKEHKELPADVTTDEATVLADLPADRCLSVKGKTLTELAADKAKAGGILIAKALVAVCRAERTFPRDEQLLRLARGDQLRQLVGPLVALNTVLTAEREQEDRARLATSKVDEAKAALERLLNPPPPPPLPAEEEGEEVTAEDSVGVKHIDQAGYTLDNLADGLQRQPPTTGDPPELDVEVLELMGERLHRLARAAAGLKGMIAELPSEDEDSGLQESQ